MSSLGELRGSLVGELETGGMRGQFICFALALLMLGCGSDDSVSYGQYFSGNSTIPNNGGNPPSNATIRSATFNFVDISDGQGFNPADDAVVRADLPFAVNWNGSALHSVNIGSNGFITSVDSNPTFLNTALPDSSSPDPFLAAYWTDLQGPGGNWVFTATRGTAPNRSFLVMWKNAQSPLAPGNGITFEAVFQEAGGVGLQYLDTDFGDPDLNGGAAATVGFQLGGAGATWCFNGSPNSVSSGSALLVTP
jgi:hypothetical protein